MSKGVGAIERPALGIALMRDIGVQCYRLSMLLMSLDDLSDAEVEKLWLEEAVRRDAELAAGMARSIPADDVLSALRERLVDATEVR